MIHKCTRRRRQTGKKNNNNMKMIITEVHVLCNVVIRAMKLSARLSYYLSIDK